VSTLPPPPPLPESAPVASPGRRSGRATAAAVILGIQAALLALTGLLLWFLSSARRHRFANRFLHTQAAQHPFVWGLVLLLLAAWLVVLAVQVTRRRGWVAVAVYITEALLAVVGLLRFRPLRSLLDVALAVAVVLLVATDDDPAPTTS
jgi:hypothetical protein